MNGLFLITFRPLQRKNARISTHATILTGCLRLLLSQLIKGMDGQLYREYGLLFVGTHLYGSLVR